MWVIRGNCIALLLLLSSWGAPAVVIRTSEVADQAQGIVTGDPAAVGRQKRESFYYNMFSNFYDDFSYDSDDSDTVEDQAHHKDREYMICQNCTVQVFRPVPITTTTIFAPIPRMSSTAPVTTTATTPTTTMAEQAPLVQTPAATNAPTTTTTTATEQAPVVQTPAATNALTTTTTTTTTEQAPVMETPAPTGAPVDSP